MAQVFAFGYGHKCICGRSLSDAYTVVEGSKSEALAVMMRRWGTHWSAQYDTVEQAGVVNGTLVPTSLDEKTCPCGASPMPEAAKEAMRAVSSAPPPMQSFPPDAYVDPVYETGILWFGESWEAPICQERTRVKVPTGSPCFACAVPMQKADQGFVPVHMTEGGGVTRFPWHKRCFFKSLGIQG